MVLDSRRLTAQEAEALFVEMDAAFATMNDDARKIADADRPWLADDAVALDLRTVGDWVRGLTCSDTCRRAIDAMLSADNGVRTEWQSYLGHLAMVKGGGVEAFWTDSELFRCTEGNQQLAREAGRRRRPGPHHVEDAGHARHDVTCWREGAAG